MKILIIGATQGTGLEAAKILISDGADVRIFARNVPKARELFGDRVEIVGGDLRKPERMPEAVDSVDAILFTAGVTKRPCAEELIISTEFEGMKKTLRAAGEGRFKGRFLFLSSIGVTKANWASKLLNKVKGNALKWRRAMEDEIRGSGFEYTIVRAGYLMNSVSSRRIFLGQSEFPLELRYRIGRKEAARLFVEALKSGEAAGKTFDAVRARERGANDWPSDFAGLEADKE